MALHVGHQAKDLGLMVRLAARSNDWPNSQIPRMSCSPRVGHTVDACNEVSMAVLATLADKGFKVSEDKLQLVRTQVTFVWFHRRGLNYF